MARTIIWCSLGLILMGGLLTQNSSAAQSLHSPPGQQTAILLQDPLDPEPYETTSGALADWCRHSSDKPALVLLSQNPFLQPLPSEKRVQAIELIKSCDPVRISASTADSSPDPTILSNMALSAALEAGLFSQLYWILPVDTSEQPISLEVFRRQLVERVGTSQKEADSFILDGDELSGMLRGMPVRALPLDKLRPLKKQAVVHFDMSFFPPLYRNEIKNPVHPLIFQILNKLRKLELTPLAVSLSRANISGSQPLSARFVADLVLALLQQPDRLDSAPPKSWTLHSEALYLENFFQNEKTLNLYRQIEKSDPANAAIKYALYQNLRRLKKGTGALDSLRRAVALDPVYALEYLTLSQAAFDKGLPDEALRMLDLASSVFQEDPFIQLRKVELLLAFGRQMPAIELLQVLKQVPWSSTYYPNIPSGIEAQLKALQHPSTGNQPAAHRIKAEPGSNAGPMSEATK